MARNAYLPFKGGVGYADNATRLNKVNKWTEWTKKKNIGGNDYLHALKTCICIISRLKIVKCQNMKLQTQNLFLKKILLNYRIYLLL